MSNGIRKNIVRPAARLESELAALRKGTGLRAYKIRHSGELLRRLARLQQQPEEAYTPQQAHLALLGEIARLPDATIAQALRKAYGLENTGTNLITRRQALASQLQKHPDTIARYENQGIHQLVTALSLKPDPSSRSSVLSSFSDRHSALEHQQQALRRAAVSSLAGLLDLPKHAGALVTTLQTGAPAYLECDVRIRQSVSQRSREWYRYNLSYRFGGRHERFSVAIVSHMSDGEQLVAAGIINEYSVMNEHETPQRAIRSLVNATRLIARRADSGRQHEVPFTALPESLAKDLFDNLQLPMQGPCRILQADIPNEWRGDTIRYEYRTYFEVTTALSTAFWYAPGLMHLRSLKWDYRGWKALSPAGAVFQPCSFLGSPAGATLSVEDDILVTYPDGWVLRGHGLGLRWTVPTAPA